MKIQLSFILIILSLFNGIILRAQEIEPRNYANIPKGLNVAALSYSISYGNIVSDAAAAIQDLKVTSNTFVLTYLRSFGLFGKLCKAQLNLPFTFLSGSASLRGKDTSGTRSGFADARFKFGINLIGAPALAPKDFIKYKEETVLGASFIVVIPIGQYYNDRLINLGSNRWGFKPELGLSRRFGPLYFEIYSGLWFFTDNNEFLKTNTLKQEPIFSFQGHISYTFPSKIWIALNGAYANGGETKVNDVLRNDLQQNWRLGGTISVPLSINHSIKALANTGVATRAGQNFSIFTLVYQYSWF